RPANLLTAATIAQAEEEVRRSRPDMIIADLHLRDGTSLDFIVKLRGDVEFASLPVLIQSATAGELERTEVGGLHGIKLLPRPLGAERLLEEIRTALRPAAAKGTSCL